MQIFVTDSFLSDLKNSLNTAIGEGEVLIQFFTGEKPTLDESMEFVNGNRISDKLGEVTIPLVDGEFDSNIDGVDPITFTPDVTGTCVWGTIAPSDSLNEIVIVENILDQVIVQDINFDSTVENNVQKILVKI
jgi:hypothetical protein